MAVEQSISEESICPERLRKLLLYDGLKRSYSPDYVSHMYLFLQLTEVVIQHTLFLVLLEADEYSVDKLLRTQYLESKSKGFTATPASEVLAAIIASIWLPITTLLSGQHHTHSEHFTNSILEQNDDYVTNWKESAKQASDISKQVKEIVNGAGILFSSQGHLVRDRVPDSVAVRENPGICINNMKSVSSVNLKVSNIHLVVVEIGV